MEDLGVYPWEQFVVAVEQSLVDLFSLLLVLGVVQLAQDAHLRGDLLVVPRLEDRLLLKLHLLVDSF